MPRPKVHDETLRARLLERAAQLLSSQGPRALSLRVVATDVGTSTSAVYSLFGGKPGLVRALYVEAFDRFGDHLRAVPSTADPAEDLVQLGLAYRRSALHDPHLYSVMFGGAVPEFEPDDQARRPAMATFELLLEVIRRGVRSGVFVGDPGRMALACWATAHGLVSLELSGNMPPDLAVTETYETTVRATVDGFKQ